MAMPLVPDSIEPPNAVEMEKRGALGHAAQCLVKAKEYFAKHGIE